MSELVKEIEVLLQDMEQTTDLFYQQKKQEGFIRLNQTLESLAKVITQLESTTVKESSVIIEMNLINQQLMNAMKALEENDTILFSDILQYELKNLLLEVIKKYGNR